MKKMGKYKYDFGLSFAGDDRKHAEKLAKLLKAEHATVFYDRDHEAELWGKDLYQEFQQIYGRDCRFFVPFISENYLKSAWPKHELKQAQARDFKSDTEYILPLRLDDTELPGLNDTIAYVDLRIKSIEEVAKLCLEKLADDSPVRQLFLFLRDNNPTIVQELQSKPQELQIRVAIGKVERLLEILSGIDVDICKGSDHHNFLMNGGSGPPGCLGSSDPEPHTIFTLRVSSRFYNALNI